MSWLSNFLGLKKVKTPKVTEPEEIMGMDEFETDAYLKQLARRSGFVQQLKTGRKLPKLAAKSYLGAV